MSMLTREGGVALTPKYAAPEQVTGGPITTATDVYTLGVLLFELLTGQHPTGLAAGSPIEFVKAITVGKTLRLSAAALSEDTRLAAERAEQRATTPDRLHRVLRGDLETIVAKALKSNPAERYASVAEFAEDLRRVLEHQPITARPDTLRYRATKFVQRHWRPLAAGLAALARARRRRRLLHAAPADRARSRALRGGQGDAGQRAPYRSAHRRRSVSDAGQDRADRRRACSIAAPIACRASSPTSRSCRPRCSR